MNIRETLFFSYHSKQPYCVANFGYLLCACGHLIT